MPRTVGSAFDQFRKDVDLDSEETNKARNSRNHLFYQIERLASKNSDFPKIKSGNPFMNFGSFARKTKIQPLDDIDFLVILDGSNTVGKSCNSYTYKLKFIKPLIYFIPTRPSVTLERFADSNGYINSRKILNKIKSCLSSVARYEKAHIHTNRQAVTLKLNSYSWNYDIVPAIPTSSGGRAYFLIPDGYGQWIATDPRIDESNTTRVNLNCDKKFLAVLRLLKYWNGITYHKPKLDSYYFETLAIKVFEWVPSISDLPNAIKLFFDRCPDYIRQECPDLKRLGPNLDADVDKLSKEKVIKAMKEASIYAAYALSNESHSNHKDAITQWQRIFGSKFPNYD